MKRMIVVLNLCVLLLLGASVVLAQDLSLAWSTVGSGGGTSAGGRYTLSGTLGRHEASQDATGGGYTLSGGIWDVGGSEVSEPEEEQIYLPAIQR